MTEISAALVKELRDATGAPMMDCKRALVDTNCDPDEADYVIPGNDDAIRSCDLIVRVITDGIAAGQQKATPSDFARREPEPVAEEPTVPEGDYEQVSPGEEPVAAAAQQESSPE